MPKEKKKRYMLERTIDCPKCATRIMIRVWNETLEKAVPAIKELHVDVEKDTQTTLKSIEEKEDKKKDKKEKSEKEKPEKE